MGYFDKTEQQGPQSLVQENTDIPIIEPVKSGMEDWQKNYERMDKRYQELYSKYEEMAIDHDQLLTAVVKTCKVLGILPYNEGDNMLRKLLKEAQSFIFDMMANPKSINDRFAFLEKFLPLLKKYQDNGTIEQYINK